MKLTPRQLEFYSKNGFLILPDFISPNECDQLMAEAGRLVSEFDPREMHHIFCTQNQVQNTDEYFLRSASEIGFFFENGAFSSEGKLLKEKSLSINKISHAMHDLNPIFDRFSRQERIKQICQDIGFINPLLIQSMYIFKQPHIGGEVVCHQDSTFLYTEPLSVVGFWFALQDATQENGCMYVLPGGHKTVPLKRRFIKDETGKIWFQEEDQIPWPKDGYIPLEAKKGALILLHGLLPHLSGANKSDFSRHAYTLHIIEGNAHYPKDNWLQRSPTFPFRGF